MVRTMFRGCSSSTIIWRQKGASNGETGDVIWGKGRI